MQLLCSALYSNFQGGHCLTHVGTEGRAAVFSAAVWRATAARRATATQRAAAPCTFATGSRCGGSAGSSGAARTGGCRSAGTRRRSTRTHRAARAGVATAPFHRRGSACAGRAPAARSAALAGRAASPRHGSSTTRRTSQATNECCGKCETTHVSVLHGTPWYSGRRRCEFPLLRILTINCEDVEAWRGS